MSGLSMNDNNQHFAQGMPQGQIPYPNGIANRSALPMSNNVPAGIRYSNPSMPLAPNQPNMMMLPIGNRNPINGINPMAGAPQQRTMPAQGMPSMRMNMMNPMPLPNAGAPGNPPYNVPGDLMAMLNKGKMPSNPVHDFEDFSPIPNPHMYPHRTTTPTSTAGQLQSQNEFTMHSEDFPALPVSNSVTSQTGTRELTSSLSNLPLSVQPPSSSSTPTPSTTPLSVAPNSSNPTSNNNPPNSAIPSSSSNAGSGINPSLGSSTTPQPPNMLLNSSVVSAIGGNGITRTPSNLIGGFKQGPLSQSPAPLDHDMLLHQHPQYLNMRQDKMPNDDLVKHMQDQKQLKGMNSMMPDRYGLLGLLTVIRMTEQDLNTLAIGNDLTTLGLNLNSPECLYSTFSSPYTDTPCRREPEFKLPHCYSLQSPIPMPTKTSSFPDETLFYIFYSMPREALQDLAAQELYNRGWRYHKELKLWLTRDPTAEVTAKTQAYERGTYIYFDVNTWEKVRKEFVLVYEQLEERKR